jgi:hypothetical protein
VTLERPRGRLDCDAGPCRRRARLHRDPAERREALRRQLLLADPAPASAAGLDLDAAASDLGTSEAVERIIRLADLWTLIEAEHLCRALSGLHGTTSSSDLRASACVGNPTLVLAECRALGFVAKPPSLLPDLLPGPSQLGIAQPHSPTWSCRDSPGQAYRAVPINID